MCLNCTGYLGTRRESSSLFESRDFCVQKDHRLLYMFLEWYLCSGQVWSLLCECGWQTNCDRWKTCSWARRTELREWYCLHISTHVEEKSLCLLVLLLRVCWNCLKKTLTYTIYLCIVNLEKKRSLRCSLLIMDERVLDQNMNKIAKNQKNNHIQLKF